MKHLLPGMHAGIRAPAAVDAHRSSENLGEAFFNHILDRDTLTCGLTLPAGKVRAVVGDDTFPTPYGGFFFRGGHDSGDETAASSLFLKRRWHAEFLAEIILQD